METTDSDDSLNGVPNVGPARRAALEAAGVTTRSQLAQASAAQLVAMTGMARSLAEKTLEFVRLAAPPATDTLPATDATLAPLARADRDAEERARAPAVPRTEETPAAATVPGDVGEDARTNLERHVVRAQTALSDLTRLIGDKAGKAFSREAEQLSGLLDALPGPLGAFKPKRLRRLAAEVEATAAQIELLAEAEAKPGKKAQRRYTAILRDDREVLEAKITDAQVSALPPKKKTDGGKKPGKKK